MLASDSSLDVVALGQVFTPPEIVATMLALRCHDGRVLEPSAGDGAFARALPGCVAIEFDPAVAPPGAQVMDFFAYPLDERFDSVIGNPPYVRYQDIPAVIRQRLSSALFDARSNLYLFFIEKCVRHLRPGGELIFITPRDFIKLTAAARLNQWLFAEGTFTHWIETGDARIFAGALPNCVIFRYVRGDLSHRTLWRRIGEPAWDARRMALLDGQLAFTHAQLGVPLGALFEVKVGAVSGADELFEHPAGNLEMVCSHTVSSGQTRRVIYNCRHPHLEPHKARLLARRVRSFGEHNWWMWGRTYHDQPGPRVYVNGKTRQRQPFFTHPCTAYDGAVLALFPRHPGLDVARAVELFNRAVPWEELGFLVDGRYLFTQRSLATLMLPEAFRELLPAGT